MSDTPQNDDVVNEEVNTVIETNDSAIDSETITPVEGESSQQVDEVEVAKQKANDAFNKQYGEKKQLERDLAEQRKVNEGFQQAERDRQAALVGNIPALPDPFDDDIDEKMRERDEALVAQATFNAQNQAFLQQQQATQQQAAQVQQQAQSKLEQDFLSNARKSGATQDEIVQVVNTLVQSGFSGDFANAMMGDSDGYFIAMHLAANPAEAHDLMSMNPVLAGGRFAELKQKASALKPKNSNAPAPSDTLQGKGHTPSSQYVNIGGAKFE